MNPVEEDVSRAVATRWDTMPGLLAAVLGGLYQEVPPIPAPAQAYAVFEVEQGPGDDEYTCPATPGNTYVAHSRVIFRVYGTRAQVRGAVEQIELAFNWKTFPVPNGTITGCLPITDGRFRREPKRKAGTDVWQGRRDYEIVQERVIQ